MKYLWEYIVLFLTRSFINKNLLIISNVELMLRLESVCNRHDDKKRSRSRAINSREATLEPWNTKNEKEKTQREQRITRNDNLTMVNAHVYGKSERSWNV